MKDMGYESPRYPVSDVDSMDSFLRKRTFEGVAGSYSCKASAKLRVLLFDHQLMVCDLIAKRDVSAHPHALLLRGGDLVADALARHLALEL
jgi:hypothetical protein